MLTILTLTRSAKIFCRYSSPLELFYLIVCVRAPIHSTHWHSTPSLPQLISSFNPTTVYQRPATAFSPRPSAPSPTQKKSPQNTKTTTTMSTTYHLPLRALRLSPLLQQPLLARPFPQSSRLIPTTTTKPTTLTRTFRTSTSPLLHPDTAAAAVAATPPIRKPAGAFRSGIVGFLLGSTLAGVATWFYIMEEYRVSNELLTEDIYVSFYF